MNKFHIRQTRWCLLSSLFYNPLFILFLKKELSKQTTKSATITTTKRRKRKESKIKMAANMQISSYNRNLFVSVSTAAAISATVTLALSKRRPKKNKKAVDVILPRENKTKTEKSLFTVDSNSMIQPERCRRCNGNGTLSCDRCNGQGVLRRGGYHPNNSVRIGDIVGSKWTSTTALDGKWRHFLCIGKKGSNMKNGCVVLSSTCGPVENRIQIEIPLKDLKSRESWQSGWTTLTDIRAERQNSPGHSDIGPIGTRCSACQGCKIMVCERCEGLGQLGL